MFLNNDLFHYNDVIGSLVFELVGCVDVGRHIKEPHQVAGLVAQIELCEFPEPAAFPYVLQHDPDGTVGVHQQHLLYRRIGL